MSETPKEIKVEVSNVVINIGEKKISLTLEEARKLKNALNELFPAPITVIKEKEVEKPYHWEYPYIKAIPDAPIHRQVVSIYAAYPIGSEVSPGYLEITTSSFCATTKEGNMNVEIK